MILVPCYAKDLKLGMFIQCNRAQEFCGRMLHTPNVFRTIENINDFSMPHDKVSISLHDTPERSLEFNNLDFFQEDIVVVMFLTEQEHNKFLREQERLREEDDLEFEDEDDLERQGSFAKPAKGTVKIIVPEALKHRTSDLRIAVEEELMLSDNGGITSELVLQYEVEVQVEGN